MKPLVQGDDRFLTGAGGPKPTDAGIVRIKKHFKRHTQHMRRPNIHDATMTGHGDRFAAKTEPGDSATLGVLLQDDPIGNQVSPQITATCNLFALH